MKKREQLKQLERQQAENRKIVEDWLKQSSSHKKPVSRRDFLTAGVQASIGTMAATSIYDKHQGPYYWSPYGL